jgi:hypothetical protein
MTEADFSNKNLGDGGAIIISAWMTHKDNGTMTSLHVGKNNIPEKEMREIMAITMSMEGMKILCEIPFKDKTLTELDVSGKNLGLEGALVVADYLDGNGALLHLDVSKNGIGELVYVDPGWTKGRYADAYKYTHTNGQVQAEEPAKEAKGAIAVANAISDNGAISSVNLLKNEIGIEQAQRLVSILKAHPTLKSLCGNKGNETELDMSGKMNLGDEAYGAEDAIMLVAEIVGNGALLKLGISENDIRAEGGKVLAEALQDNQVITELNIANNSLGMDTCYDFEISGVASLADVIPGMGALSSLNLSSNMLTGELGGEMAGNIHADTTCVIRTIT